MAKSGKSNGAKSRDAGGKKDDASAPQHGGDVVVTGTMDGKIRDVEVGLITGDVVQTNSSTQSANNTSIGGGGSQTNGQSASQTNTVAADGEADLDIAIKGKFKGEIRDVEIGLITGDVFQANVAEQVTGNLSIGNGAVGAQTNLQIVEQANYLLAMGSVEVDMVFSGSFQGKVRDLEVGLITADVTQTNYAGQGAANIAIGGGGGGTQTNVQGAGQANVLAVVGDVDITLVFEGDFKGQVRDVTIGVVTGDVSQTNTAIQVGMNISAGRHSGSQAIEQFITQTNTVDANGNVGVVIKFDPGYKGDYRDIELSLMIDNVFQSNAAVQIASNVASDNIWH